MVRFESIGARTKSPLADELAERLEKYFARGSGHGLLHLGAAEAGTSLPPEFAWWRDFAMRFVAELCGQGETAQPRAPAAPSASELASLLDEAPPMRGGEYLRPETLISFWRAIGQALETELDESGLSLRDFLKSRNRCWRLVGRVHFNLAENRRDPEFPFAFMATYTSSLTANGELRHLPLGQALREYAERDSGKFFRLREIAETVASRQEKLLVFTQFKEIIPALERLLGAAFGRPGLVLHGETPVAKRWERVKKFQEDERTPFFVLSIKAGGAGLNLTAASHVVHFDRWWNPAVENQATDRAFRIGQKRNVLVHKFVCRGTIEDQIDQLIESKRQLAADFLETGGEVNLTEMSDRELLSLVALDLNAASTEGATA